MYQYSAAKRSHAWPRPLKSTFPGGNGVRKRFRRCPQASARPHPKTRRGRKESDQQRSLEIRKEFEEAAKKEYQNVEDRGTFKTVPKTPDIKVIPLTWVFTYKFDTDGYLAKFKARICVHGDLQPKSKETYAATLAARTFRAPMAITAAYGLEAYQLDAVNAFTNSQLDETVYCTFPEGFDQLGSCLLLLRALYGLRRSPLLSVTGILSNATTPSRPSSIPVLL
jgi:hypothetical protein